MIFLILGCGLAPNAGLGDSAGTGLQDGGGSADGGGTDGGGSDGGSFDGGGSDGGEASDSGPSDACAGAPVVTWANWGHGFLVEACQSCHASTSPDRHGAPEELVFDTEADAARWSPLILAAATGEAPSMPPSGGVTAEDRTLLETWLVCYPPQGS